MTTLIDLARIAMHIYHPEDAEAKKAGEGRSFKRLAEAAVMEHSSGFQGAIYESGDEWIVAYRGTDDLVDMGSNVNIGTGSVPEQFAPAVRMFEYAAQVKGLDQIIVTGHSLGGGLAQLVSANKVALGVTFNAPGMHGLSKKLAAKGYSFHSANVLNVALSRDPISSFGKSVGKKLRLKDSSWHLVTHKMHHVLDALGTSGHGTKRPADVLKSI